LFRYRLGRHEITGVLDTAILREDGKAVVIDFKTNRVTDASLPDAVRHYTPQLQLYTLVVQQLLGWEVERAVLYFTALDREAEVPTDPDALASFAQAAEAALEQIVALDQPDDYARTEKESRCLRCGYRMICKGK
jgi:ATP-dependent helicase/nuclease subunit A